MKEKTKVEVTEIAFRNDSCADTSPIKEFFNAVNYKLKSELENTINTYSGSEKYLFGYGERTLLGLYTNAIIRGDKEFECITLQEYKVGNVRCDLLLTIKSNDKNIDIIFEAKKCNYRAKKYDEAEQNLTKRYLDECFLQGKKYYESEKKWFKNSTYIVSLIFDAIDLSQNLEMQKELKNYNPNIYKNDGIDFYSLFFIDGISGLEIYGSVKKIK